MTKVLSESGIVAELQLEALQLEERRRRNNGNAKNILNRRNNQQVMCIAFAVAVGAGVVAFLSRSETSRRSVDAMLQDDGRSEKTICECSCFALRWFWDSSPQLQPELRSPLSTMASKLRTAL